MVPSSIPFLLSVFAATLYSHFSLWSTDRFVLMVKMITIGVSSRYEYMRAYVFIDDSKDERATTFHETGTGQLRALGFLSLRWGPVHS